MSAQAECDGCGAAVPAARTRLYSRGLGERGEGQKRLCTLCEASSTLAFDYWQGSDRRDLLREIAQMLNVVLDAIEARR